MKLVQTFLAAGLVLAFSASAPAQQDEPASGLTLTGETGWMPGPKLETARAGLGAAELDGLIYAAGGSGVVDPHADFAALDPELDRWLELAALPQGLERMGVAAADGRIWVAGGYSAETGSEPSAAMWSYDPEANVWQSEPDMPGAKAAFALVSDGERLYAVGGEDGAPGVFEFDLEARIWSAVEAPSEADRRGGAAVIANGALWFIGGVDDGQASARVDVFDLRAREWREGPELPEARAGHAAAVHEGDIHVLGGRGEGLSTTLDTRLTLESGAQRWTEGELASPRTEAAAAVSGDVLYLLGGGAGAGFFAPFTAVDTVHALSLD